MEDRQNQRLTDAELHVFFDRLFPHGFAGADVLAEVAPDGWEQSPLLLCFHPSVEQRFEESVQLHRNIRSDAKCASSSGQHRPGRRRRGFVRTHPGRGVPRVSADPQSDRARS